MFTKLKLIVLTTLFFMGAAIVGCSHNIKKAKISKDTSPKEVIASLEKKSQMAFDLQADLLASEEFNNGNEFLEDAKSELQNSDTELENFREAAGYSKAYFEKAIRLSKRNSNSYKAIVDARKSALQAGAFRYENLKENLMETDEDLIDSSDNFTVTPEVEFISEFQKNYLKIEIASVQNRELGQAQSLISKAIDKGAVDKAPQHLKRAKIQIKTAENLIESNPRSPENYDASVNSAILATLSLSDVMKMIKEKGGDLNENVAAELIEKNKKISQQNQRVKSLRGHLNTANSALLGLSSEMIDKNEKLNQAQNKVNFQKTIQKIQSRFDDSEAIVYQKGNDLVIRVKKMDFAVGKSELPKNSEPVLNKVSRAVSELNASKVIVEGHTDSTGSKSINERLSTKRAKNVASYLKDKVIDTEIVAIGYGPNKPIAVNQTKDGRMLNRRVDIIVKSTN